MRRRLLVSTLAVAVLAVILLGLPLGYVGSKLIRDQARERVQREAQGLATSLDDRLESGDVIDAERLRKLAPAHRRVLLSVPGRPTVAVGASTPGDPITAAYPTGRGGTVTVIGGDADADHRVAEGWLLVAGLISLAIGVAVGAAIVQARRLSEPLIDLAVVADRLGAGDARPTRRRYGVPELDRVAEVLDRSAARLTRLLGAERDFATDASHQLRTPLTALSIRLEEIIAASEQREVREEAMAALVQAERLSLVVEQLLRRARDSRSGTAVPLEVQAILDQQANEWEPAFRHAGRTIVVRPEPGLWAIATPGGLSQALATLLDNALAHGDGPVTITSRSSDDYAIIEVRDEGPGVGSELVPHIFERAVSGSSGTGLGLALARALVESDGGRLELVRARPAVFAIFLSITHEGRPAPAGRPAGRAGSRAG